MNDETQQDDKPVGDEAIDETAPGDEATGGEERPEDSQLLSEDEVGALLDGVASGEVEISTSSGRQFAAVSDFTVPARSRLASKRLPNLEKIAERLADRIRVQLQTRMRCVVAAARRECAETAYESVPERELEPVLAVQFSAPPLSGRGALVFDRELIGQLVESYYGGVATGRSAARGDGFTRGELRLADQLASLVLESLKAVWEPLQAIEPAVEKVEPSMHLLEIAADADPVVHAGFDFSFADVDSAMYLFLPSAMIESSLPYLRGIDRDEDPARDKRWQELIIAGLYNTTVGVEATVGDVRMTLADLICLQPGDIVPIDNPRQATLRSGGVPLMAARFGVHAGRNAIEATDWLNDKA